MSIVVRMVPFCHIYGCGNPGSTSPAAPWPARGKTVDSSYALLKAATEVERARLLEDVMKKHRIYTMSFASVYPHYVHKAEKKGRKREEVDQVICWLTGYSAKTLAKQIEQKKDLETFFAEAPALHPNAGKITGVICGVRIEEIEDSLMRNIRYMDKLVDELAKGRPMEKILRQ